MAPAAALAAAALVAAGCSSYAGRARPFQPAALAREPGWTWVRGVPLVRQKGEDDCGAAALAMVIAYWTGADPRAAAAGLRPVPSSGLSAARLRDAARRRGLDAFLVAADLGDLARELGAGRPVVVGMAVPERGGALYGHYEVVVALHRRPARVVTLDPARGWQVNSAAGFLAEWHPAGQVALIVSRPAGAALRQAGAPIRAR